MKNILVTGANGFIGNAVVKELLSSGYRVYAIVRPGKTGTLPLCEACIPVECDLMEIHTLPDKIPEREFWAMYHFAWTGSAGNARSNVSLQLSNVQWTINCLYIAQQIGCKRFVASGTITEHETLAASYSDGNKPALGYIYGGAKIAAHTMSMSVAAAIGIDLLWASITNAFGPGEKSPRLINTTIQKCIKGISPQFTSGTQHYDFVYIDDVAKAFRLIGEKGKPFTEYLIGSGHARTLKDFLLEMKDVIAPDLPFIFGEVPYSGIDLPIKIFNTDKTLKDTGFKAEISFAEGCFKTFEWWKEQISKGA